jgi:hypothetical protein
MTLLTLLTKIHNPSQLKQIDKALKGLFEGLIVEAEVSGTSADRWVQVALSGEDEAVATNLLARETGFCPASLENVKESSALKGYVTNLEKSREELLVDVGVFQPKTVLAAVSLSRLQAQLVGGRKIALERIAEVWGISENMPITVKVVNVNVEDNRVDAELATEQIEKFLVWRDSLLDRLIILGASLYQVKLAVEQAELNRDVIDIEDLGMFEHALTCKLGTDAAGLIPKLGRRLRTAAFTVFSPRKITAFANSQ